MVKLHIDKEGWALKDGYYITSSGEYVHELLFKKFYPEVEFRTGWRVYHVDGDTANNKAKNLIYLPTDFCQKLHSIHKTRLYRECLPKRRRLVKLAKAYLECGDLNRVLGKDYMNSLWKYQGKAMRARMKQLGK